jgi:hypothetical protein
MAQMPAAAEVAVVNVQVIAAAPNDLLREMTSSAGRRMADLALALLSSEIAFARHLLSVAPQDCFPRRHVATSLFRQLHRSVISQVAGDAIGVRYDRPDLFAEI